MSSATLDISEARKQFNRMDDLLRDDRVIKITRHGKEAFAVVDLEFLSAVLETIEIMNNPESYKLLMASLDDIRSGRVIDQEDVKRALL